MTFFCSRPYIVTIYSGLLHLPPSRLGLGQHEQGYCDSDQNDPIDYDSGQRKGQVPPNPLCQLRGIGGGREIGQIAEGKGNEGNRIIHGWNCREKRGEQPRKSKTLHDVAGEGGKREAEDVRSEFPKPVYGLLDTQEKIDSGSLAELVFGPES